jgi:hypothetical protein
MKFYDFMKFHEIRFRQAERSWVDFSFWLAVKKVPKVPKNLEHAYTADRGSSIKIGELLA